MARLDEGGIISYEYAAMNNKHTKDIFQAFMYFTNYFNTILCISCCRWLKSVGGNHQMPCEGSKTKLTQQLFKIFRLLFIFTKQKRKLQLKCLQDGFPWRCLHLDTLFLWKLKVIPFERRVLFYKTYFWHLDWWVSELYQNHKPKLDILLQVHMIETVRTGLVSGLQLQCSILTA